MSDGPTPRDVQAVYDRRAVDFNARRLGSTMEQGWIGRFLDALPSAPDVLDLGCGSGEPVARMLLEHGCHVTGADLSPKMLELAQAAFPQATWVPADMQQLDLGLRFDGIVAWHSIFHLPVQSQRDTLPRILGHLKPGGAFMMTSGLEEGEDHGHVEGEIVYHASLSKAEYDAIFQRNGCEIIDFVADDRSCGGTNVWLARRTG